MTFCLLLAATILLAGYLFGLGSGNPPRGYGRGQFFPVGTIGPEEGSAARILPEKEYYAESEGLSSALLEPGELLWRGGQAPCDSETATVYLPYENASWETVLMNFRSGVPDGKVFLKRDSRMKDLTGAVRDGYAFDAVLVRAEQERTDAAVTQFHVVFTGLPVICLQKTDEEEIDAKEAHEGKVRLIEPIAESAGEGGGGSSVGRLPGSLDPEGIFRCSFHVRGNVSSILKKKPYKISLLDDSGRKKAKTAWLGLREDDDWILNPLFTDVTRVREMTAYELWEKLTAFSDNPVPSSRMKYVELFLDDSYQGLYGLMEPVDGKELGLSSGDILYKLDRWDNEYPYIDLYDKAEADQATGIYTQEEIPCVEIRWPIKWDATVTWAPMQAYHRFSMRTKDPLTLEEAGFGTDLDSVTALSLFCALSHASDNTWKNSFLIAKKNRTRSEGDPAYILRRTIWDMNYVFGDVFVYEPKKGFTGFRMKNASAYTPLVDSTWDFEAFLSSDPGMEDRLAQKWLIWREGGLSADLICEIAEKYRRVLIESGAAGRERERWPVRPDGRLVTRRKQETAEGEAAKKTGGDSAEENIALGDAAQADLEEWVRTRIDFLDRYFQRQRAGF